MTIVDLSVEPLGEAEEEDWAMRLLEIGVFHSEDVSIGISSTCVLEGFVTKAEQIREYASYCCVPPQGELSSSPAKESRNLVQISSRSGESALTPSSSVKRHRAGTESPESMANECDMPVIMRMVVRCILI